MYKSEGGDKQAVSLQSTQILNKQECGTKKLDGIFHQFMFAAVGTNKLMKKKSILEDQNKDLKQQNLATCEEKTCKNLKNLQVVKKVGKKK